MIPQANQDRPYAVRNARPKMFCSASRDSESPSSIVKYYSSFGLILHGLTDGHFVVYLCTYARSKAALFKPERLGLSLANAHALAISNRWRRTTMVRRHKSKCAVCREALWL